MVLIVCGYSKDHPDKKPQHYLAFILSYGDEPLLLDQPEDDLDNKLIYDLIVRQLRETKTKRQVIVVTHNANIVVNGDAEMVLPLEVVRWSNLMCNNPQVSNEKKLGNRFATFLKAEKRHLNNAIDVFILEISYVSQSN